MDAELNQLTERIIGCAIEVHRRLGAGLLESIYESALFVQLQYAGIQVERQVRFPVVYREQIIGEHIIDLLVEGKVVLELKSVEQLNPVFEAQVISYLRLTGCHVGLLINFNTDLVKRGIKRFVL